VFAGSSSLVRRQKTNLVLCWPSKLAYGSRIIFRARTAVLLGSASSNASVRAIQPSPPQALSSAAVVLNSELGERFVEENSHNERGAWTVGGLGRSGRIDSISLLRSFAVLPLDYLHEIEHASFPLEESDPARVRCVELLRAVSYVDATITTAADQHPRARVKRITWIGRTALENRRP